jgi:hypothetical protein
MKHNTRIELTDSTQDVAVKMSEGNPGALTCIIELIHLTNDGIGSILALDAYGIYGTDIYILWSDICDRNVNKMVNVLVATQQGKLSSSVLKDACSRQDYSGKKMIPIELMTKP